MDVYEKAGVAIEVNWGNEIVLTELEKYNILSL